MQSKAIDLYIDEWRGLRKQLELHVRNEQTVVLYSVTLTGVLLSGAIAVARLDPPTVTPTSRIVLATVGAVVPLLYWCLAFMAMRPIGQIVEIVYYLNMRLRPKIVSLLDDREVIGWDVYLAKEPRLPPLLLSPFYVARTLLFVVPSCLSVYLFYSNVWELPSYNQLRLLVACILIVETLIILSILAGYLVLLIYWRRSIKEQTELPGLGLLPEKSQGSTS